MKPDDLKDWIISMLQDISIEYNGKEGSICPFSLDNISFTFDDETRDYRSVDDMMSDPFIDGKPLNEICEKLTLY